MNINTALDRASPEETYKANLASKVVWNISDFRNKAMALQFVTSLRQTLCVYSNTLHHIYGEYAIESVRQDGLSLVVVPQTYSLERFTHIPENAISPTGIFVFPGWYFGHKAPYVMTLPVRDGKRMKRSRPILPENTFHMIEKRIPGKTFLPLLQRGDLREFNQRTPYVHLHRLLPEKLDTLSAFDRGQLSGLILDRRRNLYLPHDQVKLGG